MNKHSLSASILCREALVLLHNMRGEEEGRPVPSDPYRISGQHFHSKYPGQLYVYQYIHESVLYWNLEKISVKIITPMMAELNEYVKVKELSGESMEIPMGVIDAANERYASMAMRAIIAEIFSPAGVGVETTFREKFYDVANDEYIAADTVFVLRFDVLVKS